MVSLSDCYRAPWRGSCCRLSCDMIMPIVVQPAFVLFMSFYSRDSILMVAALSALMSLTFTFLARCHSRTQIFYYWTVSSVTYVIIVFENIVVPFSEIESDENFILILLVVLALFFLYLTKNVSEQSSRHVDFLGNGTQTETCPVCRSIIRPRSHHCRICQVCIPKYDYHCYWLNCCIGESNQHFFVVGIIFGMLALGYASLLILTTICLPEFVFGVLLPKDCTDVSATFGLFACFVSGVYCMKLALFLLVQLLHQMWLISRGFSAMEWKEQFRYSIIHSSPYSKGFVANWFQFIKSFRKIGF